METEFTGKKTMSGKMESNALGEVNAFLANLDAAIRKGDLETLERYYADDLCVYDMMPPLEFTGKKEYMKTAWKEGFFEIFEFPLVFDRHHKQVRVSGMTAFIHNLIHMKGRFKSSGDDNECWMRNTSILENRGGRWLIVHEHYSVPIAKDGSEKGLFNEPPKELIH